MTFKWDCPDSPALAMLTAQVQGYCSSILRMILMEFWSQQTNWQDLNPASTSMTLLWNLIWGGSLRTSSHPYDKDPFTLVHSFIANSPITIMWDCHLQASHLGGARNEVAHRRVRKWTRNVNIFEHDFLFIPICEHLHWYLIIVAFPKAMLTGKKIKSIKCWWKW